MEYGAFRFGVTGMMYSSEWPGWLKFLVILAVVVTAAGSIWAQAKDSRVLRAVARELLARDGEENKSVDKLVADAHVAHAETVKGGVIAAAKDSKATMEELASFKDESNTKHRELVTSLDNFKQEYLVKHAELERRVSALELDGAQRRQEGEKHGPA